MTTFSEIGINKNIIQGLTSLGFEVPTPVQEQIIPMLLERQIDLVGLAQTGTGKTAAFGIPLIQLTDTKIQKIQSLVLCPTRELCVQVSRDLEAFARYVDKIKVVAVYGGASIEQQISSLRRGANIIVATPGRLNDLVRRRAVDISHINLVVLDEADEMLQMGFQDELNAILAETPESKNTLLFSATMPRGVKEISRKYMNKPQEITVGQLNAGAENVRHLYYTVQARDRYQALKRLVDMDPDMYGIVFCRTRQETKDVADKLIEDGYGADALHGDLSQAQRDSVMSKFRRRNMKMLVATDVAARGLDVNDLTHVINYNLPDEIANYTHRSGRTGRAGKSGISIAIINMREKFKIREIENNLQKKFEEGRIPTGQEVCQKQLINLVETVKNVDLDHAAIDPFLPAIMETLAGLDREELIKRFVSSEFNRFLDYYRNAPDLNKASQGKERGARRKVDEKTFRKGEKFQRNEKHQRDEGVTFSRFTFNVGKNDGLFPQRLIGHINDNTNVGRIKIGKIEIKSASAMIEADSRFKGQVLKAFGHMTINGKEVSVELSEARGQKSGRSSDYVGAFSGERKSARNMQPESRKKTKGKKSSKSRVWDSVSPSLHLQQ